MGSASRHFFEQMLARSGTTSVPTHKEIQRWSPSPKIAEPQIEQGVEPDRRLGGADGTTMTREDAALGALAFGSSLAIAGPLSNYGAGLTLILTRPFVIGNTITVQGVSGVVDEIRLAATLLDTEDGEQITIPNKHIVGEILVNSFENKVIETSVGISYRDDPEKAIEVLQQVLVGFEEIPLEPAPQIGIEAFADSSINIGLRYWVPTKMYFHLLYQVNLAIHKALTEAQISIPFPQRDIHIVKTEKETQL